MKLTNMFKPSPLKHKEDGHLIMTEEAHADAHGGEIPETEEELSEDQKDKATAIGVNAGIDALVDIGLHTTNIGGMIRAVSTGMDLYHSWFGKDDEENEDGWSNDDYVLQAQEDKKLGHKLYTDAETRGPLKEIWSGAHNPTGVSTTAATKGSMIAGELYTGRVGEDLLGQDQKHITEAIGAGALQIPNDIKGNDRNTTGDQFSIQNLWTGFNEFWQQDNEFRQNAMSAFENDYKVDAQKASLDRYDGDIIAQMDGILKTGLESNLGLAYDQDIAKLLKANDQEGADKLAKKKGYVKLIDNNPESKNYGKLIGYSTSKIENDGQFIAESKDVSEIQKLYRDAYFDLVGMSKILHGDDELQNQQVDMKIRNKVSLLGKVSDLAVGLDGSLPSLKDNQELIAKISKAGELIPRKTRVLRSGETGYDDHGLQNLPGSSTYAKRFNEKLNKFRILNRALQINMDPTKLKVDNILSEVLMEGGEANTNKEFAEGMANVLDANGFSVMVDDEEVPVSSTLENRPGATWEIGHWDGKIKGYNARNLMNGSMTFAKELLPLIVSVAATKRATGGQIAKTTGALAKMVKNSTVVPSVARNSKLYRGAVDIFAGAAAETVTLAGADIVGESLIEPVTGIEMHPFVINGETGQFTPTFAASLGAGNVIASKTINGFMKYNNKSFQKGLAFMGQSKGLNAMAQGTLGASTGTATMAFAEGVTLNMEMLKEQGGFYNHKNRVKKYKDQGYDDEQANKMANDEFKEHFGFKKMTETFIGMGLLGSLPNAKNPYGNLGNVYKGFKNDIFSYGGKNGSSIYSKRAAKILGLKEGSSPEKIDYKRDFLLSKAKTEAEVNKINTAAQELQFHNEVLYAKKLAKEHGQYWNLMAETSMLGKKVVTGQKLNAKEVDRLGSLNDYEYRFIKAKLGLTRENKGGEALDKLRSSYKTLHNQFNDARVFGKDRLKMMDSTLKGFEIQRKIESLKREIKKNPEAELINKSKIKNLEERLDLTREKIGGEFNAYEAGLRKKAKQYNNLMKTYAKRLEADGRYKVINTEQYAKEIAKRQGIDIKQAREAAKESAGFYDRYNDMIFVNKQVSEAQMNPGTAMHEVIHRVLRNSLKNPGEAVLSNQGVDAVKSFIDIVKKKSPAAWKVINDRVENNYKYKYDKEGKKKERPENEYYEEYLNTYFDGLTREQIKYDKGVGETLSDFVTPFVRKVFPRYQRGKKYSTETGKDLYNMMRDFHKSSKKGEVLEPAIELAKEGPKKETGIGVVESREKEIRDLGYKKPEVEGELGKRMTKSEWDAGGMTDAYLKLFQGNLLDGVILKGIDTRNNNVFGKPVGEYIKAVKDQILEPFFKFNPEVNDNLSGYMNFIISKKRPGILERFKKEAFTKEIEGDRSKQMSVETKETKETEGRVIKLYEKLGPEGRQIAEKIRLMVEGKEIHNLPEKTFKNLKDLVSADVQRMFGIKPKKGNLTKEDVRNAQMFINKRPELFINMLPEGATPSGTSTGVPKVLLSEFYTKTDRAKMAKTGTKAGLAVQVKKPNIAVSEFLEAFGITERGKPNLYKKSTNVSSRIKALVAQTERMMVNQVVREKLMNDGVMNKAFVASLGEGKSGLMFAKDNYRQGKSILDNYGIGEVLKLGKEIFKDREALTDAKFDTKWRSTHPELVNVLEQVFNLPYHPQGKNLGKIIKRSEYTPENVKQLLSDGGIYSGPRAFGGKDGKTPNMPFQKRFVKNATTTFQAVPNFVGEVLGKNKGLFKNAAGRLIDPTPWRKQIDVDMISKLTPKQEQALIKEYKEKGLDLNTIKDYTPTVKGNKKIKPIIKDITGNDVLESVESKLKKLKTHQPTINKINIANPTKLKFIADIERSLFEARKLDGDYMFVKNSMQSNFTEGINRADSKIGYFYIVPGKMVATFPKPPRTVNKVQKPLKEYVKSPIYRDYIKDWQTTTEWAERFKVNMENPYSKKRAKELGVDRKHIAEMMTEYDLSIKNEHLTSSAITHAEIADYVYSKGESSSLKRLGENHVSLFAPNYICDAMDAPIMMGGKMKGNKVSLEGEFRMTKFLPEAKFNNIYHNSGVKAREHLIRENKIVETVNEIKSTELQNLNKKLRENGMMESRNSEKATDRLRFIEEALKVKPKRLSKKKARGMSTFDFDETVGVSENYVIAKKGGKTKKIASNEWPFVGEKLKREGWEMDFSDFNKVTKGKPGPLMQKMKNQIKKFGPDNVFILTARAKESAPAIHEWLKSEGVEIPLKNITGLGNSTGTAKAKWMLRKFEEGYNDMYFVDDALPNVKAVKHVLEQLDIKSKVRQAIQESRDRLDASFNDMLERKTGVASEKEFKAVTAKMMGATKGKYKWIIPPGAADFELLTSYTFAGKGKKGEADMKFFEENLSRPFAKGINEINTAKQRTTEDYLALRKKIPGARKLLNKKVPGTKFTHDAAIRVHRWTEAGYEVPGLSKVNLKKLNEAVNNNPELKAYSEALGKISKQKEGWIPPTENWLAENITADLNNINNKVNRAKYLDQWIKNKDIIFSEKNLNKMEAMFGSKHRDALEDMLYRMENGTNRPAGRNKLTNQFMNWTNNSVGAIMFFNMRSAGLQLLSSVNYVNWAENNPYKAAKAFANQPRFWKDFATLFNSDMLKQRRAGLKMNVNEAEIAAAVEGSSNKASAALNYILKKGFLPTQIADSFAISSGGATFYRNRIEMYKKQGLNPKAAKKKAFTDFQEIAEKTQQSARPDLISQQQASPLGRLILAFANTPMQYARIMKKSTMDLASGRGDAKSHVSRIAFYGAIQSMIFAGLQSGMFSMLFNDDLPEDYMDKKTERMAHTMTDGLLRGIGVGGASVSAIKNAIVTFMKENDKEWNADYDKVWIDLLNVSPPIGSKVRKLKNAGNTWQWNKDLIPKMGLDIENPGFYAGANVISATTNVPLDRLITKVNNIKGAMDVENEAWQRIAQLMGYNRWDLGMDKPKAVEEAKEELKAEKAVIRKQEAEIKKQQKKIEKEQEEKRQEEENKKLQKEEKKKGKEVMCAAISKSGKRCKTKVVSGKSYCTVHEKTEQRVDGKQAQCKKIKKGGKRCKMQTSNKSGYCYYHD